MADITTENLNANVGLVEAYDGSIPTDLVASAYLEEYLFNVLTDLNAINDEVAATSVTDGDNVGTGAEVFQIKDGSVLDFRTLVSADASVTITQNADEINLAAAQISGTVANSILTYDLVGGEYTEFAEMLISFSGGLTTQQFEDSGGGLVTGLTVDGDADVAMFYDGTEVARTMAAASGGLEANNASTGAGFERVLTVSDLGAGGSLPAGTTSRASLRWDGAAWVENTEVLQNTGNNKLEIVGTATVNMILNGATGFDSSFRFEESGVEQARVFWDASLGIFSFRAEDNGGLIELEADNVGGTLTRMLLADPDGAIDLYYDGHVAMATTNQAAQFTAGTGVAAVLEISADTGQTSAINFEEVTSAKMQLAWLAATNVGHWRVTDTTDDLLITNLADGDMARFNGGGAVELYFNGTLEAETKSGGFRIDDELEIDGALNHDGSTVGFYGTAPAAQSAAYTRNATVVESRTLLASASATTLNNNNVLAALIADLQSIGLLA